MSAAVLDLTPGSPEWSRRVSPSKAAAILGVSPWESQYSIYRKMRGEAPWDAENEAMERGNLCEPAVLAWWRKHHDHDEWAEQITLTIGDWLVATPDAVCRVGAGEYVVVQAKTTGSQMDEWGEPGTADVPTHVLVQVNLEMEVARRNGIPVVAAHVPVLGGYRNLFTNYVVPYDAPTGAALMARMEDWVYVLVADSPPPLDDSLATWEAVRKVHPDIDRGEEVELGHAEALAFAEAMHAETTAARHATHQRSLLVERMGRAQFAVHNGTKVARRQPRGDSVSFVPLAKTPSDLPALLGDTA